jgi:hypothetical protein
MPNLTTSALQQLAREADQQLFEAGKRHSDALTMFLEAQAEAGYYARLLQDRVQSERASQELADLLRWGEQ